MNTETQKIEYITRKTNVADINKQILEKNADVEVLKRKIDENVNFVRDATQKIEIEKREIALGGALSRRTLSAEQLRDLKKEHQAWLKDSPILKDELDSLNQDLTILQSDLASERRALGAARAVIVAGMVDKAADEFSTVAGESLKHLVFAIVANAGKDKGYSPSQQQQFTEATFKAIFQKILPNGFADNNSLPDLHEANTHINALIEANA